MTHHLQFPWWLFLLLPPRGNKRNLQSLKRIYTWIQLRRHIQPLRVNRDTSEDWFQVHFEGNNCTGKMLNVDQLLLVLCFSLGTAHCAAAKREYQIQNGPCSYTFLLPEQENCQSQSSSSSNGGSYNYPLQKDGPEYQDESAQRLEQLEMTMENNTQWLLKVEFPPTPLCHDSDCDLIQSFNLHLWIINRCNKTLCLRAFEHFFLVQNTQ